LKTPEKPAPKLWATGCPGCRVNLASNLGETDKISVLHPIELVEMALKEATD
jgi:Fe-S oxidoreductase